MQDPVIGRAPGQGRLRIKPRYYRWHVDPGVDWTEENTRHAFLDWTVPIAQSALVLIDVWDNHYLKGAKERAEAIIHERLRPLVDACREHGMLILHAPSPTQAQTSPFWVGHDDRFTHRRRSAGAGTSQCGTSQSGVAQSGVAQSEAAQAGSVVAGTVEVPRKRRPWPPPEFRRLEGEYAAYARPAEPRAEELAQLRAKLDMHPAVLPQEGDVVVATLDEFQAVLEEREILFLFYTGFNTNACILEREYSLRDMSRKGYTTLLVRDCTTAMESYNSVATLGQTNAAIEKIEMFLGYTVTSEEMIQGLSEA